MTNGLGWSMRIIAFNIQMYLVFTWAADVRWEVSTSSARLKYPDM